MIGHIQLKLTEKLTRLRQSGQLCGTEDTQDASFSFNKLSPLLVREKLCKRRRVEPCEFGDEPRQAAYSSTAASKPSHLSAPEVRTHDQHSHGFFFSRLVTQLHADIDKGAAGGQTTTRCQWINKEWRSTTSEGKDKYHLLSSLAFFPRT